MNERKRVAHMAGRMRYIAALLSLLLGAQVWAQGTKKQAPVVEVIILLERPRVSALPLEAEQSPRGRRWNALLMQEVSRQQIHMTPEVVVEEFLATRAAGCEDNLECLAALGRSTRAHYVLSTSMDRTENTYTVTGRVLQTNGIELKKVGPLRMAHLSRLSEDKNVHAVFEKLFAELKLAKLNPSPDVSFEEPRIITETVVEREIIEVEKPLPMLLMPTGLRPQGEVEAELRRGPSPMRMASYGLFGAAGAGAIVGTVFAGLADSNYRKYRKFAVPGNMHLVRADVDLQETQRLIEKVSAYKTASIVSFSVAGAAAIAATTLFFLSPERYIKNTLKVGLAPMEGGALFHIEGAFP